jgi:hypothetical protein
MPATLLCVAHRQYLGRRWQACRPQDRTSAGPRRATICLRPCGRRLRPGPVSCRVLKPRACCAGTHVQTHQPADTQTRCGVTHFRTGGKVASEIAQSLLAIAVGQRNVRERQVSCQVGPGCRRLGSMRENTKGDCRSLDVSVEHVQNLQISCRLCASKQKMSWFRATCAHAHTSGSPSRLE